MPKVRMLTTAAGPGGVLLAGKVYNVTAKTAKDFIEGRYAEEFKDAAAAPAAPPAPPADEAPVNPAGSTTAPPAPPAPAAPVK